MINDKKVDVLLVEDDLDEAALTMRALKQRNVGNNVFHAVDGDEALEFLFTSQICGDWERFNVPRLILLDLKLRKVSGLDVLRELKAHERTKVIPVVVLTSSADEVNNVASYKLGVNSFVIKPGDNKKYAQVIGDIAYYWLTINEAPHRGN